MYVIAKTSRDAQDRLRYVQYHEQAFEDRVAAKKVLDTQYTYEERTGLMLGVVSLATVERQRARMG